MNATSGVTTAMVDLITPLVASKVNPRQVGIMMNPFSVDYIIHTCASSNCQPRHDIDGDADLIENFISLCTAAFTPKAQIFECILTRDSCN